MTRIIRRMTPVFVAAFTLSFAPTATLADGVLDKIQGRFQAATPTFLDGAMSVARDIFVALIALEVIWALIEIFLERRSLEDFISGLTLKIVSVGAAVGLLTIAPTVIPALLTDFARMGAVISNGGISATALSPSQTFGQGLDIAGAMAQSTSTWAPTQWLSSGVQLAISEVVTIFAYGVVACSLLLTWIEAYVIVGSGAFLLGFIGSRWTLPWAERYFAMLIAVCVKLTIIMIIVSLGQFLSADWITDFDSADKSAIDYIAIAGSALIYGLIAWTAPRFVANLVGASPALSTSYLYSSMRSAGGQIAGATQSAGSTVQGALERAASFSK